MTLKEFLESLDKNWYRFYKVEIYTSDYIFKKLETFPFKDYLNSKHLSDSVESYSRTLTDSTLEVFLRIRNA